MIWYVAFDTFRLRHTLSGRQVDTARTLVYQAARFSSIVVIDAFALNTGVRALVQAGSRKDLRRFIRRLAGLLTLNFGAVGARWRERSRIARIASADLRGYRRMMARGHLVDGDPMIMPKPKRSLKQPLRNAIRFLPLIEHSNDASLGCDEAASRVRRYMEAHETPHDDQSAFAKLCAVIFAQGLGFEVVDKHWSALTAAFDNFSPAVVAGFDEARVAKMLSEPVIRNRQKIEACIENAKRWTERADGKGYLTQVAQLAGNDDMWAGWPDLAAMIQRDFCRFGEPTARMVLKRWGFFTAKAHPGAQRLVQRLGFVAAQNDEVATQRFVSSLAQTTGKDPYAIEAAFAIFAGVGPCRAKPDCAKCVLNERCPSADQLSKA